MRRSLLVLSFLLALLAIAAAAAWVGRVSLANYWLDRTLVQHGYPDAEYRITRLAWADAVLENVRPLPDGGPTFDRIEVDYSAWGALVGDWRRHVRVTVVGMELALAPWAGAETRGAGETRRPGRDLAAVLAALPMVRFEDAAVRVDSPLGKWRARVQGEVGPGRNGRMSATVRNDRLRVDTEIEARLADARLDGELTAREDDGFVMRVAATGRAIWDRPKVELRVESEMPAEADLPWALLPGPAPSAGRLRLDGRAAGDWNGAGVPDGLAGWVRGLAAGGWAGEWRVDGDGLALAKRLEGVEVDAEGVLEVRGDALAVQAEPRGGLRVARVHEALRAHLPGPMRKLRYTTGPVDVTWPAGPVLLIEPRDPGGPSGGSADGPGVLRFNSRPSFEVAWPGAPGSLEGRISTRGSLTAAGRLHELGLALFQVEASGVEPGESRIERLRVAGVGRDLLARATGDVQVELEAPRLARGPLRLDAVATRARLELQSGDGGVRRLRLAEPAQVRAEGWAYGERVAGRAGLAATLDSADVTLGESVAWEAEGRFEDFSAGISRNGRSERATVRPGSFRLFDQGEGPRVVWPDAEVAVPAQDLRLSGLAVELRPRETARFAQVAVERIAHTADRPLFAPLAFEGQVGRTPSGLTVIGQGRVAGTAVDFEVEGALAPEAGAGSLRLDAERISFRPGGLQPARLAPPLGVIEDARGTVSGRAELRLADGRLRTGGALTVDELSFATSRFSVEGLSGDLSLASLRPPRADPGQSLRARSIDAGVTVSDARMRFGVVRPEGGGTALAIEDAHGRVLGGIARVRNWTFDPGDQVHSFFLELDRVELDRVLDRIDVQGLEGEGQLSGGLPIMIVDDEVTVQDGRLRGGAGRIRFRSRRAREAMASAGRSARLMLDALEDFRYESMEMSLDRALEGESELLLQLDGHNPEVMDGERFEFDIRFTGDAGPLLAALVEGRPLTDELIERNLDLREAP